MPFPPPNPNRGEWAPTDPLALEAPASVSNISNSSITNIFNTTVPDGSITDVKIANVSTLKLLGFGCKVFNSAANNTATGVAEFQIYNTEVFDQGNFFDTTVDNTKLFFPFTGVYVISAMAKFVANATGVRTVNIVANASTNIATSNNNSIGAGTATVVLATTTYKALAGEFVRMEISQTSGGNLQAVGGVDSNFLTAVLLYPL